ncbi:MAG: hypothetical protein JWL84_2620 [Rhodospirillales bacterium]|nr:hypothetical protein [Rhodospirillales bacterium]
MTRTEARATIIVEWFALPPEERGSEHQAAVFAMKAMAKYDFRCAGDRYQIIKSWLTSAPH